MATDGGSDGIVVDALEHLVRAFARAIRVADGDAVFAEAGGDGRALAFGQVFEVQVAHLGGGIDDGADDAGFLGMAARLAIQGGMRNL